MARQRLFAKLGISGWRWPRDPDGFDYGFAHLRLRAADLARLGTLWMDLGRWRGEQLVDSSVARAMVSAQNAGGWAGQHVTVLPASRAVIVTTGDPRFDPGPPPTDQLRPGWQPARLLVTRHLLPAL